ncbi:ketopantoate reductase family protein [Lichenifustis flavocetrariae]|uniref:2-dehydropantoate 2-reductase n=1 Tax=Lichenifustis flavocetrariae TaxID=2949735 RepID=A0AA42CLB6_9HYPH|nr:2-dehydropantoate 2-reductase [Lichenifustis flavocetrariae]MCW6510231.1 2-dehydropantoate 2-reductase [Lichenifustis flavocetrariae]
MPSSSPLNIAVVGAGRIGSTFGFQLARTGRHVVTMVARPGSSRLQQLRRDGGIVDIKGARAATRVADSLDEQTPYDLVIVTLLAHQVDAVLPALQRSAAKCIQFMFNTFEPERLRDAVGPERCSFGMPFVQANLDDDGKLKAVIGSMGQKTLMGQKRWVDLFNDAGLPAALEHEMTLWLRCHAPLCVAFESVCIAGQRRGGGASWGEVVTIARGVQESFALVKGLGYPIYPRMKARLSGCPVWVLASVLWFMSRIPSFRELLATGGNECRALVDSMLAAAPRANPPVVSSRIKAMRPL